MKKRNKFIVGAALLIGLVGTMLTGCSSDADTVNQNISTDAEQFKIQRQIVFYNSITDKYVAVITGKCSVDASDLASTITVTCKIGADKYIKDYFRNADNVTWFMLQTKPVAADVYHYKIVFKPAAIIPNLQVETDPHGGDTSDDGVVTNTVPDNSPLSPVTSSPDN